jgi:mono/diheme cytochrome c family protein
MDSVTRQMMRAVITGSVALGGVWLWTPALVHAGEADAPSKAAYTQYCRACHGYGGKGDGAVASFLATKPTDLTQLAKKNGGKFPMMKTLQSIDGSTSIRAHGDSDMPVWGERFRAESSAPLARQAEVRGKLLMIADYIRSIQEK